MESVGGSLWQRVSRHPVFQNALALYGVQAANFLLPLVALPYVARVLQPEAWGAVVFAQSFAIWLTIVVEYGFIFSATRDVARHRDDPVAVQRIVAGVLGAKLALVVAMSLISLAAFALIANFRHQPEMLIWAWLLALGQGMSSLWYFQGVEQIRLAAGLEVIGRLLSVLGIFVLVRNASDAPVVIALQAVTAVASSSALFALMYRNVRFCGPTWAGAWLMLISGFSMFFYRAAVNFYTSANALILGVMTNATQVGLYGSAERIVTAANAVYWPFWRALYPRINYNLEFNRQEAVRLARFSFRMVMLYGIAVSLAIILLSQAIVPILLGSGYESTIQVLQILAIIIPFVGATGSLGLQWMVPNRLEKELYIITITAAIVNVSLALILIPAFLAKGIAISVVSAEIVNLILMLFFLNKKKILFA